MSMVIGLDPHLYIIKTEDLTEPKKHLLVSSIIEMIEIAKKENVQYLYNTYFDNWLPDSVKNIFDEIENDPAYIALMLEPSFEYIKNVAAYTTVDEGNDFNFEAPVNEYIYGLFLSLRENYHNSIIVSDEEKQITINANNFYFRKGLSREDDISIGMLEVPLNINNLEEYFPCYNWFFGKESKKVLLSDTFIHQVSRLDNNDIFNIATSMFRGIYYPDYLISHGAVQCQYTIETHSDKSTRYMYINGNSTTLFRIHCVDLSQTRGGVKRICYTENEEYVFVFYYHNNHCNSLYHTETINHDTIKRFDNSAIIKDIEYKIEVRK